VEEGQKWHEAFKANQLSACPQDSAPVVSDEEDDGMLYEALDELEKPASSLDSFSVSHSTGEMSKSVSFASEDILLSERGSVTRSDSRHSELSDNRESEPRSLPTIDMIKVTVNYRVII
jgi:hypothetical protein